MCVQTCMLWKMRAWNTYVSTFLIWSMFPYFLLHSVLCLYVHGANYRGATGSLSPWNTSSSIPTTLCAKSLKCRHYAIFAMRLCYFCKLIIMHDMWNKAIIDVWFMNERDSSLIHFSKDIGMGGWHEIKYWLKRLANQTKRQLKSHLNGS